MKARFLAAAALLAVSYATGSDQALAACNSNSNVAGNCFDEFSNAAKATVSSTNDPQRAQSVGEAVRNCRNCATETLSNQMREFAPSNQQKK